MNKRSTNIQLACGVSSDALDAVVNSGPGSSIHGSMVDAGSVQDRARIGDDSAIIAYTTTSFEA